QALPAGRPFFPAGGLVLPHTGGFQARRIGGAVVRTGGLLLGSALYPGETFFLSGQGAGDPDEEQPCHQKLCSASFRIWLPAGYTRDKGESVELAGSDTRGKECDPEKME